MTLVLGLTHLLTSQTNRRRQEAGRLQATHGMYFSLAAAALLVTAGTVQTGRLLYDHA